VRLLHSFNCKRQDYNSIFPIEKGINMERKERYENIEELEKELTN